MRRGMLAELKMILTVFNLTTDKYHFHFNVLTQSYRLIKISYKIKNFQLSE